jgi:phage terminase large subunit
VTAVDAHLKVPYIKAEHDRRIRETGSLGGWIGGLDVGDSQDGDRNALTLREWIIWRSVEEWVARDTGVTARTAITRCQPYAGRIEVMYDCIGVGSGVKTEYNRLTLDDKVIDPQLIPFVPWNAGAEVMRKFDRIIPDDDQSPLNKDFYDNMKAQAWWSLRTRFFKTFKAVTEGTVYPCDDLISLDSSMVLLHSLQKELSQPTRGTSGRLKMMVDKKPEGTKSPNLADSGVQAFFPIPGDMYHAVVGTYG